MSLRVSFELEESDLKHFRLIMREARKAAATIAPEDIVASAESLLLSIGEHGAPKFVRVRLDSLRLMIAMLTDIDWRLPHQEAKRVLNALAYFTEPEDLIPDHIPGLGFLDDAIMIELVSRDLKHELEAYEDFCNYRNESHKDGKHRSEAQRAKWLKSRRKDLQDRMRRRRRRAEGSNANRLGLFR
jgi:uncharacterized membrane protein YkvA (DUF1232 family)